jgi:hypothetical protein
MPSSQFCLCSILMANVCQYLSHSLQCLFSNANFFLGCQCRLSNLDSLFFYPSRLFLLFLFTFCVWPLGPLYLAFTKGKSPPKMMSQMNVPSRSSLFNRIKRRKWPKRKMRANCREPEVKGGRLLNRPKRRE